MKRYTKAQREQIAVTFALVKARMATGDVATDKGKAATYGIAFFQAREHTGLPSEFFAPARAVMAQRLYPYETLPAWLQANHNVPAANNKEYHDKYLATCHAWFDSLIEEFNK